MLYNLLSGLLRALGNSKVPLYFLVVAALLNVVLDLVFIINFHMGTAGAAYATVISQRDVGAPLPPLHRQSRPDPPPLSRRDMVLDRRK